MVKIDCDQLVKVIRENKDKAKNQALKQAQASSDIWEKCTLLRSYTSSQGTDSEKLIKNDLKIEPPKDGISGDGFKNGLNYEIKVSVHDANFKLNVRQIRPHHNVDFYIIMYLNIWAGKKGEAYIFRVPAQKVYDLVLEYGGYTHGTVKRNGEITANSIKDRTKDFEYSLSANPNANNNTKTKNLWNELIKYNVPYDEEEF